jgi:hypothetical protein
MTEILNMELGFPVLLVNFRMVEARGERLTAFADSCRRPSRVRSGDSCKSDLRKNHSLHERPSLGSPGVKTVWGRFSQ